MIIRSSSARQKLVSSSPSKTLLRPQTRTATLLRRPKRPYQFTQLVTLSDGSTFTHRTTSPLPVYKSIKDVRNSPLWNPSSQRLNSVEEDEAGRLARFRERFGRGWDAAGGGAGGAASAAEQKDAERDADQQAAEHESLLDLISNYKPGSGKTTSAPQANQMRSGPTGKKK